MTEWLSHENELGRKPHKIEVAGQFERHDMQYYIIKYKKNMLGGWLLGVCGGYEAPEDTEHCGHIFSEMQPYDQVTAEDEAIRMVEMIREYWMQQAAAYEAGQGAPHEEESSEDGNGSGGVFNGFVLLNSSEFDIEQLKSHLQQDWNITVSDAEKEEDQAESDSDGPPPLVFEAEGCMLAVSFINAPVPDDEAVRNAASNYLWPQAPKSLRLMWLSSSLPSSNGKPRNWMLLPSIPSWSPVASSCQMPSASIPPAQCSSLSSIRK